MTTRILFLAAMAGLLTVTAPAADSSAQTSKLIAVLRSDAPVFEKARACQQLGEIGTADAIPALAELLPNPQLSAYARSGLEGIPGPAGAALLRQAAVTLKGPLLTGVVNSLGALRDTQAVELLGRLAADPNSGVVNEALLALGNIASSDSIRLVERQLARGPEANLTGAAAACLLAADRQRAAGNLSQALDLYDAILKTKAPAVYRAAATRGAILAQDAKRAPFLVEQLKSSELAIRNAALLTIREIPDERLAAALNAEVGRATPELQGQLLLAIADCHNAQSVAAVQIFADSANRELRKTALMVLPKLGPSAAPALLAALGKEQTESRAAVLEGLKAMPGSTVDDQLVQALRATPSQRTSLDLIRLLDNRGVTKASGEILKLAKGPDKEVSIAALSALKSLAGPLDLPELITLVKSCGDDSVRDAAENALAGACSRPPQPNSGPEAVLAELKQTSNPSEKNSWIRVLATLGYGKALPAIEAAAGDANEAVAENALAQLGGWPDPAPMETLLKAMNGASTQTLRKRALASVIDLAATATDETQRPEPVIVEWLQRADSAAQSIAERRRILGILGRLKSVESFRLLASHLDNPVLRTEAASGVVQIAPGLLETSEAGTVKIALEKIAATVDNEDLRKRAQAAAKTLSARRPQVSLFDGQSLSGWEGDTTVWRVRDHAIVGGSLQGNRQNEFLVTVRNYTNFVLRLEYKLVGTEGFINSGVQFRSVRVKNPPNEMSGYQADIGAGYSGCLYDESRRNKFLAEAYKNVIQRLEKPSDWNRYEMRCEGPHIQLWVNGEKTVDYSETDASIPQHGLIGLQIHGGNKAEVCFRNLTLQEL